MENVNEDNRGNVVEIPVRKTETRTYAKISHLFAYRKKGVQKRFEKVYADLKDKVQVAWLQDLEKMELEGRSIMKSNQALAKTKMDYSKATAAAAARATMNMVFNDWRTEIDRVISVLNGYPQEDGNILFPDGSTAVMPKGLYIPKEMQLNFS